MAGTQGNAEGEEQEEEEAAEGAGGDEDGDEDEDLSPLVCIIWDRSSVTEGDLYRLVVAEEMKQMWPNCERNILSQTVQSTQTSTAFAGTSFTSTIPTLVWTSKHTHGPH